MAVVESPTVDQPPNLGLYRAEMAKLLLDVIEDYRPPLVVRELAACRGVGVDVFFPERGERPRARDYCDRCAVAEECRAWARRQGSTLDGWWGGESARERRSFPRPHRTD